MDACVCVCMMIVYILHSQLICACVACANIINALDQFSIYIEIGDCDYTPGVVVGGASSNTAFTSALHFICV